MHVDKETLKKELEQLDLTYFEWQYAKENDLSFGYKEINRLRDIFYDARQKVELKYDRSLKELREYLKF